MIWERDEEEEQKGRGIRRSVSLLKKKNKFHVKCLN